MGMTQQEIAKKIKEKREQKKLTQAEVAKKAGLNTNYYAVIERAEINPSLETLNKIFDALDMKLSLH
jgi:transcriptional regulator with XRE-family HTH domain